MEGVPAFATDVNHNDGSRQIPTMTEHFSSMADTVLSSVRDPNSGVVLAANGMKRSVTGVQEIVGSLPTLGMTAEGRHKAVEGLKNIVNGFSQTFQGISLASMKFNAVRLSLVHGAQAKQIMELQMIREAILRGEEVPTETLEKLLKETTSNVQGGLQTPAAGTRESSFTSAGVIVILSALAVIAVILAILKLPVLLILDSLLTALAVLLGLLSML